MRSVVLTSVILLTTGMVFLFVGRTHVQVQSTRLPDTSVQASAPAKSKGVPNGPVAKASRPSRNHVLTVVGDPQVTVTEAQYDVLIRVQIELEKYLRTLDPPIYWKPSPDWIRTNLVKEMPPPRDFVIQDPENRNALRLQGHTGDLKFYELEIEITPSVRRDLLRAASQHRSEERLLGLLPLLGGVVLLLLAGSAYIQLDERTKGYYTGWLRLAASGVVAAAFAWWWLRHGIMD